METDKPDFSVLTMNLRFGLADDAGNSWSERRRLFPKLFSELQPDLICFQESNDFQIDFLQNVLSDYRFIGKRHPAPAFWQNNVIFFKSDWACRRHTHRYLSHTPDIPSRFQKSRWPRQCTFGLFEREGQSLGCFNTHFDFKESVQEESARMILREADRLPGELPVILAGDFNAIPGSGPHRILTESRATGRAGFHSAFHPENPGTHHGFTGSSDGDHIDWILYRGRIAVCERRVMDDPIDGRYPSDHFPLIAGFRWKD